VLGKTKLVITFLIFISLSTGAMTAFSEIGGVGTVIVISSQSPLWQYGNEQGFPGPVGVGWTGIYPITYPGGVSISAILDGRTLEGQYALKIVHKSSSDWGGPYKFLDEINLSGYDRVNWGFYFWVDVLPPAGVSIGPIAFITTQPLDPVSGLPARYEAGGEHHDLVDVRMAVNSAGQSYFNMRLWLNDGGYSSSPPALFNVVSGLPVWVELEYDRLAGVAKLYLGDSLSPVTTMALPSGWRIIPGQTGPPQAGRVSHVQDKISGVTFPYSKYFDRHVAADHYIGSPSSIPSTPSPPHWSDLGYNSTDIGSTCKFSAKWTDSDGLSGYIFSWNGTGVWSNSTWTNLSGTVAWSNVTKTLPLEEGAIVSYRFYANETNKGWNATSIGTLTTTKPLGWEQPILTLRFDPDDPPVWADPPKWYTIIGDLKFANGSGIESAWLRIYVGYGSELHLVGVTMTRSGLGEYSFTWSPTIGKSPADSGLVKIIIKIVYESDRPLVLGTSVVREVVW